MAAKTNVGVMVYVDDACGWCMWIMRRESGGTWDGEADACIGAHVCMGGGGTYAWEGETDAWEDETNVRMRQMGRVRVYLPLTPPLSDTYEIER